MQIHQLKYLVIINQERNLSRAAEKCFITESALSQFIAKLERSCNSKLFLRAKNVMTPTALGSLYVEAAQKIVGIYDQLQIDVENYNRIRSQRIMLGMTTERSEKIFPYIYKQFHNQYPEVSLQLVNDRYQNNLKRLSEGKMDMTLTAIPVQYIPPHVDALASKSIFGEDLVLIVPPEHRLATYAKEPGNQKVPLSELDGESYIGFEENMLLHLYVNATLERLRIHPNKVLRVGSNNTCIEFVSKGIGVSIVPRYLIPSVLPQPICILRTEPQLCWEHKIFYPKQKKLTAFEKRVIQLTAESFRILSESNQR